MLQLRLDRIDDELGHAVLVQSSVRLLGRAQHVGALPSLPGARTLDRLLLQQALQALAAAGIAETATGELAAARAPADLIAVVRAADASLEVTPVPHLTRPVALALLGAPLLRELLDADPGADLDAPDDPAAASAVVAQRLHQLALTTADLAGAYDDEGTRRWFARPRRGLDGTSPVQALRGGFDPDGDTARQVRGMAAALTRLGAT